MTDYLTNHLEFLSNNRTIIAHLRSKLSSEVNQQLFSLNSIKPMPDEMQIPISEPVKRLSLMNTEMPFLEEDMKRIAVEKLGIPENGRKSDEEIEAFIDETRHSVSDPEIATLEKAITNYREFGFFSQLDWRLKYWGTDRDVHSVVPETFQLPTKCIEFQTCLLPPIPALETLVQAFPSVRFYLKYRYESKSPWKKMELFPAVPFGY